MAYTTPPTWSADTIVASDDLQILSDDISYLKGVSDGGTWSAVRVARTSSQSVTTATNTLITWQTETYDAGSYFSSGTDIVIPAGAIPAGFTTAAFHVIARVQWATNANGRRRIAILLNGAEAIAMSFPSISGDNSETFVNDYVVAASGDVVTIQVYQNSGGNLNATAAHCTVVRHAPVA